MKFKWVPLAQTCLGLYTSMSIFFRCIVDVSNSTRPALNFVLPSVFAYLKPSCLSGDDGAGLSRVRLFAAPWTVAC